MPRFHFELIEDGVIARSHYGLELHAIAVDDLDSAVDLAQLLARRAVDRTMRSVVVTISDHAKNPIARIRLSPKGEAARYGPAGEAANAPTLLFDAVPARGTEVDERLMLDRSSGG